MHVFQVCDLDAPVGDRIRGVYGILNVVNGKWYIGQSIDMRDRLHRHRYRLRFGNHDNEHLQASFSKHGESSFEYLIIGQYPDEELDLWECFWIDCFGSADRTRGYNIEPGGGALRKLPEETRVKMSEAHKGKTIPPETRDKISKSKMGRPTTEETRKKLAAATTAYYAAKKARECPGSRAQDISPDPSLLPEREPATAGA